MVALVPAFEPGASLLDVVRELRERRPALDVVVVDDGSGPAYAEVFGAAARLGAQVVTLDVNRGKGVALKAGFAWVQQHLPGAPVVCADADGQHAVDDVLSVLDRVSSPSADARTMVLGTRALDTDVPARSRLGNDVTRWLFGAATGRSVSDTQTGLRGYPPALLGWLQEVEGERYEYELNLLLHAARDGIAWETVPIETIYLDDNAASHFRPLRDSVRIYLPLLAFLVSSMTAFLVDTLALLVLDSLTGSLLVSVVGARLLSASVNFASNRHVVFRGRQAAPRRTEARRYAALAAALLGANYLLLRLLGSLGLPLLPAKVVTELALFVVSYAVQRRVVFRSQATHKAVPGADQQARTGSRNTPHTRGTADV